MFLCPVTCLPHYCIVYLLTKKKVSHAVIALVIKTNTSSLRLAFEIRKRLSTNVFFVFFVDKMNSGASTHINTYTHAGDKMHIPEESFMLFH